jgi:cationic peptide transport system substrate-binding protein
VNKFILFFSLFVLNGCNENDFNKDIKGLVYCSEANPVSFNPQVTTTGSTIDIIANQLYDRLINIDPNTGEFTPALATSWKITDKGKKITFRLRKDVQFHHTDYFTPTRNFNADDVIFTFGRLFDVYNPFHFVGNAQSPYPYFRSIGLDQLIKSIHKDNEHQVTFELFNANSSFLANIATDFAALLSAEYAAKLIEKEDLEAIDKLPVGTGPYFFKEYKRDILVRYYKNPDYWHHQVNLDQLVFDITPNATTRIAKMMTHECDVTAHPNATQLSILAQRSDIKVQQETYLNIGYWAFNTQKPPFDNPNVRRALAHAIDIDKIMDSVFLGTGKRAQSLLPPTSWAYQAQANFPSYNPELAKRLLDQAGLSDGFRMEIWAAPVARIYNPNARKMAELMQSDLKKVGITVKIVEYEWNTFLSKLEAHQHDSVLIGWAADSPDPDNFFSPILSCAAAMSGKNQANWCNSEFDLLLTQALDTTDIEKRKHFYFQAQQILIQQLPLLPLSHGMRFQATTDQVSGIELKPFGGVSLANARVN